MASASQVIKPGLPKTVTIGLVPKLFDPPGSYLMIAAWAGQEHSGPFGHGSDVREAINDLVDVTEAILSEAA